MDALNLDLSDQAVPPPVLVPAKTQCRLRITSMILDRAKSGRLMFTVALENVTVPNADVVFDRLVLPIPADEESKRRMFLLKAKDFSKCFAYIIPPLQWEQLPVKLSDAVGHEGWVLVDVETSDEFGTRNTVGKYICTA